MKNFSKDLDKALAKRDRDEANGRSITGRRIDSHGVTTTTYTDGNTEIGKGNDTIAANDIFG